MNDLRTPIGIFFLLLGILLLTVSQARAQIEAGPVNLYSGIAMLIFGGLMLFFGIRARTPLK